MIVRSFIQPITIEKLLSKGEKWQETDEDRFYLKRYCKINIFEISQDEEKHLKCQLYTNTNHYINDMI